MAQWPVFNGRLIVPFPSVKAPMACEITITPMVASITSQYSGQLTVTAWPSKGFITLDLTYPPLTQPDALSFVEFFASCDGQSAVFTLPSPIANIIPTGTGITGYYQLSQNVNKYSINIGMIYGTNFSIREVLSST
jgi:hypothetical protein